jgi:hypothetical protein
VSLNLSYGQNTIGTLRNDSGAFAGYTLFSPNFSTQTYLINNCGEVVNEWTSAYRPGVALYLLDNGNLLRTGGHENPELVVGAAGGQIELFDWDSNLLWEYTYLSSEMSQHHDIYPLPNGNILMLGVSLISKEEAIQAGRDSLQILENLYNEHILELEPIGTNEANVVWEWHSKDHFVQDFDASKDNFSIVSESPELIDINYAIAKDGIANWLHINSINYNADLDQIMLSVKNFNEIFIIDHSTTSIEAKSHEGGTYGRGGDLLFRWGNPEAYDHGTIDDKKLFGQHYAHWIADGLTDAGKIMVYNNGDTREYSSVEIINPEVSAPGFYVYEATKGYLPESAEWIYKDEANFHSKILSSGQRLPNGNTFICEGTTGRFFEIDSDENIVWEYVNPENVMGIASQGEVPTYNYVFRALKFGYDHPAFEGKNISQGDPIEKEFDINTGWGAEGPFVLSLMPENGSLGNALNLKELVISFDIDIEYRGGDILLKNVSDESIIENFTATDNIDIVDNQLILSLSNELLIATSYYVVIPEGAILDSNGRSLLGFDNVEGWSFSTNPNGVLSLNAGRLKDDGIVVYPNPSRGQFSIDLFSEKVFVKMTVSDMSGKVIVGSEYFNVGEIKVELPELSKKGLYLITIESNDGLFHTRISIK